MGRARACVRARVGNDALIFGQVVVELDVAPAIATLFGGLGIELGGADAREVEVAKDADGVEDKSAEGAARGGEIQAGRCRKVGRGVVEDEAVGQQAKQGAVASGRGRDPALERVGFGREL